MEKPFLLYNANLDNLCIYRGNITIFFICILLFSCSNGNNNLYFRLSDRSINSCDGSKISNLLVQSSDGKYFYHFTNYTYISETSSFNLSNIDSNYSFYGIPENRIDRKKFRLYPNKEYQVTNQSHQNPYRPILILRTDSLGNIYYSNHQRCEEN